MQQQQQHQREAQQGRRQTDAHSLFPGPPSCTNSPVSDAGRTVSVMQPSPALFSAESDERSGRPPSLRRAAGGGSLRVYDSSCSGCSHSASLPRFMHRRHARPVLTQREGAVTGTSSSAVTAQRRGRLHPAPTPPHGRSSDAQLSCTAFACMPVALLRAAAALPVVYTATASGDAAAGPSCPPVPSSPSLLHAVDRADDGGSSGDVTLLLIPGLQHHLTLSRH